MLNIAIDGPAGAGKSTVAKEIARRKQILYLDTGAMYRAMGLKAVESGIDPTDRERVIPMAENTQIDIRYENGAQSVWLDGENVNGKIRTNEISRAASDISAIPEVRLKLVELQRDIARRNDVVMDGRDIGTYVLPDANKKFYVTASAEARAHRRYLELVERGIADADEAELLRQINERDYNDSHRTFAPLKQADDAVFVDTTAMSIQECVEFVLEKINETD